MPPARQAGKRSSALYALLRQSPPDGWNVAAMMGIALGCFIGLFAFGHQYLGWHDPHGQVQLGLEDGERGHSQG
jgi:hypothetical protein